MDADAATGGELAPDGDDAASAGATPAEGVNTTFTGPGVPSATPVQQSISQWNLGVPPPYLFDKIDADHIHKSLDGYHRDQQFAAEESERAHEYDMANLENAAQQDKRDHSARLMLLGVIVVVFFGALIIFRNDKDMVNLAITSGATFLGGLGVQSFFKRRGE